MSEAKCRHCGNRIRIFPDSGVWVHSYDNGRFCGGQLDMKGPLAEPAEPSPEVAPMQRVIVTKAAYDSLPQALRDQLPAVAPRETQSELQTRIKQLRYVAERAISQGKDEVQIDAMELLQFVARLEGGR